MRLLILTPTLPYPLHQGGAIRNYGIIHGLHTAGHDITLLCFHNGNPSVQSTPLENLCSRIETVPFPQRGMAQRLRDLVLSQQPDLAQRLKSKLFSQRLCSLLEEVNFDVVQFEGLEMARFLPIVRQYQPNTKLVYDAHNAESALQEVIYQVDKKNLKRLPIAIYSRIQAQRIAHFEHIICQQVDAVIAVSEEDARILRPFRTDHKVTVVSNGIFADDYESNDGQLDLGNHVLTFTGKMDYRPNIDAMLWFSEAILPLIHLQVPDVRLYIVGQKPHPRLETLRDKKNIELTGWVPKIRPFLHATHVYVAPLRMGSGTRLKILEAMASGCAVVATQIAAAGIADSAHEALIVADTEEAIAQNVIALLKNPAQSKALGQAARDFVQQNYDWSLLIPHLLQIYKEMRLE